VAVLAATTSAAATSAVVTFAAITIDINGLIIKHVANVVLAATVTELAMFDALFLLLLPT